MIAILANSIHFLQNDEATDESSEDVVISDRAEQVLDVIEGSGEEGETTTMTTTSSSTPNETATEVLKRLYIYYLEYCEVYVYTYTIWSTVTVKWEA